MGWNNDTHGLVFKSNEIKLFANGQHTWNMKLSQLARTNKMPNLSDLRYSGMLEQIADSVLFIMRPEYYLERGQAITVPEGDKKGVAYIQVAKNRNGPVGLVRMAYISSRTKFADLETQRIDLNGK